MSGFIFVNQNHNIVNEKLTSITIYFFCVRKLIGRYIFAPTTNELFEIKKCEQVQLN